jgi:hypothetical protein
LFFFPVLTSFPFLLFLYFAMFSSKLSICFCSSLFHSDDFCAAFLIIV